jgi:hypothetical protein
VSTSIAEINRIVRTDPKQLKFLFKSPTEDKRRLTRLISHLVPYRVGLEFETFGAVGQNYYTTKELKVHKSAEIDKMLCSRLKIVDFSEDEHTDPPIDTPYKEDDRGMNEVRVSFSGYRQLIPFWNTIQILKKCLVIPKINGGIHIHIDAPFVREQEGKEYAVKWFDQDCILNEILQVFEGYKGTYNQRHASIHKGNWVRVSGYPTIEFRIARLTYDYKTIIRWIISCSDLVRRCKVDYLSKKVIRQLPRTEKFVISNNDTIRVESDNDLGISEGTSHLETVDRIHELQDQVNQLQEYVIYRMHNDLTSSNYTTYNSRIPF